MVLEPLKGVWMWRQTALLLVWRSEDKRLLWPWLFSEAEAGFHQGHMVQSDKAICCSASTAVGGRRKMKGWFVGGEGTENSSSSGVEGLDILGDHCQHLGLRLISLASHFFLQLSFQRDWGWVFNVKRDHDFVIHMNCFQSDEQWGSVLWRPCKLWIQFLQHLFAPKAESCGSAKQVGADLWGGFDGWKTKNCTLALPQTAEEPNGWLFLWGTL